MVEVARRRFIQTAAAASAVAAGGQVLGEPTRPATLKDIDHIIILMKENRSFDHYFGTMRGVRGFDDPTARRADGKTIFHQADPQHADGHVLPFRMNTLTTSAQRIHDLSHGWGPLHASWNGGAMDNWVPAHRASDGARGPMTMGYLTREDIPYYHALADAFTLCDGYHCSVMGPTHPNRYYLMTAQIDSEGLHGGPALNNDGLH